MTDAAVVRVDARGMRCPLPVLRLARALREHPEAAEFELFADDPAAARDVPAFAGEQGVVAEETGPLEWRIRRAVPGQSVPTARS
ncbi:MAG: sulfurtransferase TusA family protein [Pseudomonadota bacterium]|nr:sulfurtransferase TusA family protein [Pseudomonadota bacterium]